MQKRVLRINVILIDAVMPKYIEIVLKYLRVFGEYK